MNSPPAGHRGSALGMPCPRTPRRRGRNALWSLESQGGQAHEANDPEGVSRLAAGRDVRARDWWPGRAGPVPGAPPWRVSTDFALPRIGHGAVGRGGGGHRTSLPWDGLVERPAPGWITRPCARCPSGPMTADPFHCGGKLVPWPELALERGCACPPWPERPVPQAAKPAMWDLPRLGGTRFPAPADHYVECPASGRSAGVPLG